MPRLCVEDAALTYVVKVCLIIAIVFTYPMQLFPVTEIFDFVFLKKASENLFDVKVRQPPFILSFFHSFALSCLPSD